MQQACQNYAQHCKQLINEHCNNILNAIRKPCKQTSNMQTKSCKTLDHDANMYACMHACMYGRMNECLYVCLSVCLSVCLYAYIYVCMHARNPSTESFATGKGHPKRKRRRRPTTKANLERLLCLCDDHEKERVELILSPPAGCVGLSVCLSVCFCLCLCLCLCL